MKGVEKFESVDVHMPYYQQCIFDNIHFDAPQFFKL